MVAEVIQGCSPSFKNHSIYSSLSLGHLLGDADRLKDVSKSLLCPLGLCAAGISHTSSLLVEVYCALSHNPEVGVVLHSPYYMVCAGSQRLYLEKVVFE